MDGFRSTPRRPGSRPRRATAPALRQRGGALLIVLLMFVLAAGYAGMRGISAAYAQSERDARTLAALQQAKQALLGYAANRIRLHGAVPSSTAQGSVPGPLPCPALSGLPVTDPLFGRARTACNASSVSPELHVGRLPWRTLEIPELTDASGEALWYVVSSGFRYQGTSSDLVNLDSQGRIRLLDAGGAVVQGRIVAVIVAPGRGIADKNQVRGTTAELFTAANYLERYAVNAGTYDLDLYAGRPNLPPFTRASGEEPFNDLMVTITEAELFDAIDTGIAMRINDTIMPILEAHRAFWGTLPYATGSFNPLLAMNDLRHPDVFTGDPGNLYGQLPAKVMTRAPSFPPPGEERLRFGSPDILVPALTPAAIVDCGYSDSAELDCDVDGGSIATPRHFEIDMPVRGVNAGVFDAVTPAQFVTTSGVTLTSVTASANGSTLDSTLKVRGTVSTATARVELQITALRQRITSAATSSDPEWWFTRASWPRFVYYARCTDAATACMTVTERAGAVQSARAVLLYPGRTALKADLSVQNRTLPNAPAEYFEAPHDTVPLNNGAAIPAFRRALRTTTFNDRVALLP